jgi:lipopolysaccharide transport system ATP-binding protein
LSFVNSSLLKPLSQRELDPNAIIVENLYKRFRIPHERKLTTYEHVIGFLKGGNYSYEAFDILNGINFSVKRGETFGVIGPNGSGKSTLLKILAGVLYPDGGNVKIHGRIAPFLELGVGFHPELTAKENVYLYGAIMGLTKRQIDQRYEDIMDFSELKRFENMKLRNFSSGMVVRLAFSTAIQTDPDIMLVDEVLSVGDEAFQRKCGKNIDDLRRAGKTILLVSHSLDTVLKMCDRCLLLSGGKTVAMGETEQVVEEYMKISRG